MSGNPAHRWNEITNECINEKKKKKKRKKKKREEKRREEKKGDETNEKDRWKVGERRRPGLEETTEQQQVCRQKKNKKIA